MIDRRAIPSPLGREGKGEGRAGTLTSTLSLKVRGR
jgi:hypothetical protein